MSACDQSAVCGIKELRGIVRDLARQQRGLEKLQAELLSRLEAQESEGRSHAITLKRHEGLIMDFQRIAQETQHEARDHHRRMERGQSDGLAKTLRKIDEIRADARPPVRA